MNTLHCIFPTDEMVIFFCRWIGKILPTPNVRSLVNSSTTKIIHDISMFINRNIEDMFMA
jgi:hypothetical protein